MEYLVCVSIACQMEYLISDQAACLRWREKFVCDPVANPKTEYLVSDSAAFEYLVCERFNTPVVGRGSGEGVYQSPSRGTAHLIEI